MEWNDKPFKKLLVLSTILPSLCYAQMTIPTFMHGFYVGPNVSVTGTTISNHLSFNAEDIEDVSLYTRNSHANTAQVQPGFLIGYEYNYLQNYLFSAEFQANFLKSYINSGGSDYIKNVISTNNQYALQIRAGYNLTCNDNTIYVLLGMAQTNVKVNVTFDNSDVNEGTLGHLQLNPVHRARNLRGVKVGVGYEKRLSSCLAMRIDYSHTQYNNFNNTLTDMVFFDVMGPSGKSKTKLSTDMLGVTLVFMI